MKVLYITSGATQLYPHRLIDSSIKTALQKISHKVRVVDDEPDRDLASGLYQVVEEYQPDYVFTIRGNNMSKELVAMLKEQGAVVGIWFIDDPYDIDESVAKLYDYDVIYTNEKRCQPIYQERGYTTFYLPLGTVPEFYYPEGPENLPALYLSDVCILGSPFLKRVKILKSLLTNLSGVSFKIVGPYWNKYFPGRKEVINLPVDYNEIRRFYNGAQINLNIHRAHGEHIISGYQSNTQQLPATSPNNRIFDVAACKAFQLSDNRLGLKTYFCDDELITFEGAEDLLKKIQFYLHKPIERKKIAENSYYRTIEQHCMANRLGEMMQRVESMKGM